MPTADIPFRSAPMRVDEAWIDYNGHLNMAYYNVLFDRGVDEVAIQLGMGPGYVKQADASFFTAEVHICYVRELSAGDMITATTQLIGFDAKRMHIYQELHHCDGWLSATSEQMALHVDLKARKVTSWPPAIASLLDDMRQRHATLGMPQRAGRRIALAG